MYTYIYKLKNNLICQVSESQFWAFSFGHVGLDLSSQEYQGQPLRPEDSLQQLGVTSGGPTPVISARPKEPVETEVRSPHGFKHGSIWFNLAFFRFC